MTENRNDTIDFRIDWGYAFVYSRRHYHPEYSWDGNIECEGGAIESVHQLEYPYTWWGPVHTAVETRLPGTSWRSTTRRGMSGIRVVASAKDDTVFQLHTAQGSFRFSVEELRREGRIVFPVGWKYSHCTMIVTQTGHLWFRNPPRRDEINIEAAQIQDAEVVNFSRMEQAWIEPGHSASFSVDLPARNLETARDCQRGWLFHMQAMTAENKNDPFELARDYMPMEIREANSTIATMRRLFRWHDASEQILHDVYTEIPLEALPSGPRTLEIVNRHENLPLLVHRVSLQPIVHWHLDIHAPNWVLTGREFVVPVRVLLTTSLKFRYDPAYLQLTIPHNTEKQFEPGIHEFTFIALKPLVSCDITVRDKHRKFVRMESVAFGRIEIQDSNGTCRSTEIEAVYDLPSEQPEVKVGYDMTTVPHDENEFMDWLLEYTWKTQLGNLVCFRPFPMGWGVDDKLMAKWGKYCREHHVYVEGINMDAGSLPATAGDYFHGLGTHELSGKLYFCDPTDKCTDMKQAMEGYIAAVRAEVQRIREGGCPRVAFGDASGGHRYALMAGADFLRAETMVPNTQQHLSQARASAQAVGCGEWGVHIAVQHPKQPYLESHLGWYYLSLMQAWMMGASFLYEEDSLFVLFKEERQGWEDKLTKGKRDMTRDFFRFASTHPRAGATGKALSESHPTIENPMTWGPQINIAFILGRYAAPFNGFICGTEQTPAYSVWGEFGRNEHAWGHLQPEKCQQVLDVLMPGASTHPFRQRYDRRRFFFSGTPYGDFDQVPAEATSEFLERYKMLLHLGWNTMIDEDYEKLKRWVSAGGTLLIGVPQFSTHVSREFLLTMDDLALYRGGDATDLCGARITAKGARYCGHWTQTGPEFQGAECPLPSRVPSATPDEDGPCHLAEVELNGAVPILIDAISGKPMLLKYELGDGIVYLITTWAYAGHEELADFSGAVVAHLADEHKPEVYVTDPSNEVFWTWWPSPDNAGCGQLMMLNTDWTERGNVKQVTVHSAAGVFPVDVREREASIATVLPFAILQPQSTDAHVEIMTATESESRLRIHAAGKQAIRIFAKGNFQVKSSGQLVNVTNDMIQNDSSGSTVSEIVISLPGTD